MTQALSKGNQLDYEKVKQVSRDYQIDRNLLRNILGISESTQFRYEKKNPVLKPNIVDRWSRFERVLRQAEELFADKNETIGWLSTSKVALEGKTPLEVIITDAGSKQVEQILTRAEYGIFG
ncbi:MAG: antitoxin Xre/MbcA/ParS toxin-binding domain-containing protein [Cyanobacteria bacterium P01_F01_bin.143]